MLKYREGLTTTTLLEMEIRFHETLHKFSKAEKGVSSQWYDSCSLHSSLRALGVKAFFKGYIWISATVREVFCVCKNAQYLQ